jgi:hypothetical protein
MRIPNSWVGSAFVALALVMIGCTDDRAAADVAGPNLNVARADPRGVVYDQVEFLGNPLVSEVTIVKANHNTYNRVMPYNAAAFRSQTEAFITGVAGRPLAYAQTVSGVLYAPSDMLIVDSSKPASTAGWLTWALGSPYFTGAPGWGGRTLADDVVDVGLIAIFSSSLSAAGASCAPFALPLCTDNVPANDKAFLSTFPYLAAPTL